jgi:hypothetical protein
MKKKPRTFGDPVPLVLTREEFISRLRESIMKGKYNMTEDNKEIEQYYQLRLEILASSDSRMSLDKVQYELKELHKFIKDVLPYTEQEIKEDYCKLVVVAKKKAE